MTSTGIGNILGARITILIGVELLKETRELKEK